MELTLEARVFSRKMFRICLALAVVMLLVTVYWWMLWEQIWGSPVESVEQALYGRDVTGILARLWPLPEISPAKLVTKTSADSFLWVTIALASWTWFWLKTAQGREKKAKSNISRAYSRTAFIIAIFMSLLEGFGLDTAVALLPTVLILIPLEVVWRRFCRTYQPDPQ